MRRMSLIASGDARTFEKDSYDSLKILNPFCSELLGSLKSRHSFLMLLHRLPPWFSSSSSSSSYASLSSFFCHPSIRLRFFQDDCAKGDGFGASEEPDEEGDMPRVAKDEEKSPVERFAAWKKHEWKMEEGTKWLKNLLVLGTFINANW